MPKIKPLFVDNCLEPFECPVKWVHDYLGERAQHTGTVVSVGAVYQNVVLGKSYAHIEGFPKHFLNILRPFSLSELRDKLFLVNVVADHPHLLKSFNQLDL